MGNFFKKAALVAALSVVGVASFATESSSVTIPTLETDVGAYITAAIALMGGVVGVAVGGYAAFLVVKKALRWLGRALG